MHCGAMSSDGVLLFFQIKSQCKTFRKPNISLVCQDLQSPLFNVFVEFGPPTLPKEPIPTLMTMVTQAMKFT